MQVKIYHHSSNLVYDVVTPFYFVANNIYVNINQPMIFNVYTHNNTPLNINPIPPVSYTHLNAASRTLQNVDDKSRTDVDLIPETVSSDINWDVDPTKYEYNMNAIIVVAKDQVPNVLKEGDEVGVFVNNEVRGSSKAMYIPTLQSYMIFLTCLLYTSRCV